MAVKNSTPRVSSSPDKAERRAFSAWSYLPALISCLPCSRSIAGDSLPFKGILHDSATPARNVMTRTVCLDPIAIAASFLGVRPTSRMGRDTGKASVRDGVSRRCVLRASSWRPVIDGAASVRRSERLTVRFLEKHCHGTADDRAPVGKPITCEPLGMVRVQPTRTEVPSRRALDRI